MDGSRRLTLTVPETAELLGVSRAFAYTLVARGELPSLRLGRRVVVPRVAIDALVASCAEADPATRPHADSTPTTHDNQPENDDNTPSYENPNPKNQRPPTTKTPHHPDPETRTPEVISHTGTGGARE